MAITAPRLVFLLGIAVSTLVACGDNAAAPRTSEGPKAKEPEQKIEVCERLEMPVPEPSLGAVCSVEAGGETRLIKGTVLTPGTTYIGGQVAFDAAGKITCVGCNCAAGGETVVTCPQGVISPGLINTHEHLTFSQNPPLRDSGERYEHRNDWRAGLRGHTTLNVPGSATNDQVAYAELRGLVAGATSVNGSGDVAGLQRNLDRTDGLEGLEQPVVQYQTFPLTRNASDVMRRTTCNYGASGDSNMFVSTKEAYTPHVSEGIDQEARNEFLCTSSDTYDADMPGFSNDVMLAQTAVIHGAGLLPADYSVMAQRGSALIWSPRTNISLYGNTAQVTTASNLGVEIALGTDWLASGSTNMVRELKCADELNKNYYGGFFSDAALWRMATINAASALAMEDAIGVLAVGNVADIAIYDGRERSQFRAIIDAQPRDVTLVIRGGKALYGDEQLIRALRTGGCDQINVCGVSKQLCLMEEIGKSWPQLLAALPTTSVPVPYPAFYCGIPQGEPTCKPTRAAAVNGSTIYTGDRSEGDLDGDGLVNRSDNCPTIFNPVRPLDNGQQADADGDGEGDACDACPLTADSDKCDLPTVEDRDGDGLANENDNCPFDTNSKQADADGDGKGDVCDECPMAANMGATSCPATIYAVKKGIIPVDAYVKITNALVTGKGSNGFFIQVKEGDAGYAGPEYSGLFVFTTSATSLEAAEVGARVNVEGQMTNFFGQLEISNTVAVSRVGSTVEAAPAPTPATLAEIGVGGSKVFALESVIVQTATSTVTAINTGSGEFTATQAALNVFVDDFLFVNPNFPGVSQSYATLAGILAFRNGGPRLEPRNAEDLNPIARLGSISTTPAFVRVGQTDVAAFPTPLTVRLTMPVRTPTFIAVTSADTDSVTVVGGGVTIPAGQISAPVKLTGIAQAAAVDITASLAGQTETFTTPVRVLGDAEVPSTVTISPARIAVSPGASATVTVTLDLPAAAGGAVVNLSLAPANAGTIPTSVTVAAEQTSATFVYTNNAAVDAGTLTASFEASTSNAAVVQISPVRINELDYDQDGGDTAEFIELYNTSTTTAANLTNLSVVFVNGSANPAPTYKVVPLGPANGGNPLPPGGYLVISVASLAIDPGGIRYTPATGWAAQDNIQNGSPDGVLILNTASLDIVDAFSYEGSITAATVTGVTGPVNLVEGTVLPASVVDLTAGSLCRFPNGRDTNNAATDWRFCAAQSPGKTND